VDYEALANWCRERRGQKIVCEPEGAAWLPFQHLRLARNSIGHETAEVIWTESPAYDAELGVELGFMQNVAPATGMTGLRNVERP
jgi:hypothetical protein